MSVTSRLGRLAMAIAALLTGAVLFTACGGDGDSDSKLGPDSVSKDDFIAKADALCADYKDESESVEDEINEAAEAGDLDTVADLMDDQLGEISATIDEIEELDVPKGDEDTIDEWLSLTREQAEALEGLPDAVRDGDEAKVDELTEQADEFEEQADEIADEYGMDDCGSGSGSGSTTASEPDEDFVAAANEICSDHGKEAVSAQQDLSEARDAEDREGLASATEELAGIMTDMADELEELDPPEGQEAEVDEWMSSMRDTFEVMEAMPASYRNGDDTQLIEDANRLTELVEEAEANSEDLGLDQCALVI